MADEKGDCNYIFNPAPSIFISSYPFNQEGITNCHMFCGPIRASLLSLLNCFIGEKKVENDSSV